MKLNLQAAWAVRTGRRGERARSPCQEASRHYWSSPGSEMSQGTCLGAKVASARDMRRLRFWRCLLFSDPTSFSGPSREGGKRCQHLGLLTPVVFSSVLSCWGLSFPPSLSQKPLLP